MGAASQGNVAAGSNRDNAPAHGTLAYAWGPMTQDPGPRKSHREDPEPAEGDKAIFLFIRLPRPRSHQVIGYRTLILKFPDVLEVQVDPHIVRREISLVLFHAVGDKMQFLALAVRYRSVGR